MIDPFIFRNDPGLYARSRARKDELTPTECEVVQDEIVRRYLAQRDAPIRVPPGPAAVINDQLWRGRT